MRIANDKVDNGVGGDGGGGSNDDDDDDDGSSTSIGKDFISKTFQIMWI